jgi:hypothetical protein
LANLDFHGSKSKGSATLNTGFKGSFEGENGLYGDGRSLGKNSHNLTGGGRSSKGKLRGGGGEEEVGLRYGLTAEKFGTVGGGKDEFRFELKKNENFLNVSDDGTEGEAGVED